MNTEWHFPIMILASVLVFVGILRMILPGSDFKSNQKQVLLLSLIVIVAGMLIGKYGATYGLPWWIYYPIPMLMTVLIPPVVLKLNTRKTITYLILSFLSAPFIHYSFLFLLGWTEYMPFLKNPFT